MVTANERRVVQRHLFDAQNETPLRGVVLALRARGRLRRLVAALPAFESGKFLFRRMRRQRPRFSRASVGHVVSTRRQSATLSCRFSARQTANQQTLGLSIFPRVRGPTIRRKLLPRGYRIERPPNFMGFAISFHARLYHER